MVETVVSVEGNTSPVKTAGLGKELSSTTILLGAPAGIPQPTILNPEEEFWPIVPANETAAAFYQTNSVPA